MKMKISDVVYGEEEIKEHVLIDLINSKSLQRLKGISQYMPEEYFHKKEFTRYEHSIGVLILLRRLRADLKEQIAGLIHDVSHTAFSHVADFLFGDTIKEDYQDKNHKKFIENSDIPMILSEHGFDYKDFLNLEKYTLLEREIPELCADRVDYALRQIFIEEGKKKSDYCMEGVINMKRRIVFNSYEVAKFFSLCFLKYQVYLWGSYDGKIRFKILAEILDYALKKEIIVLRDLWKDDKYVLSILRNVDDEEIISRFKLLEGNSVSDLEGYKENIPKKFRYIDPIIFIEGEYIKLSEISEDYRKLLNIEKEKALKLNSFALKN